MTQITYTATDGRTRFMWVRDVDLARVSLASYGITDVRPV